jgi:hypothetical protein
MLIVRVAVHDWGRYLRFMSFRTDFPIPKAPLELTLSSHVLALGSCFAEVVGQDLRDHKLSITVNPFGTLFDPLAIFRLLEASFADTSLDERLIYEREGRWVHHHLHSSISGETPEVLQAQIQSAIRTTQSAIQQTDCLILTFGTAWVQRLLEPPAYVANAHKRPARDFERDLLSVKDVVKAFGTLHATLKTRNPKLQTVLTVSPVRHAKQGLPDNQVSKSVLRLACHYLTTDYADVHYFPAYELLLDDLRDYRFYADDLVHPSAAAERYIAGKFRAAYFSEELNGFVNSWQKIRQALAHRPFNETTPAYRTFLENLLRDLNQLPLQVDVSAERAEVEARLKKSF